MWTPLVLELVRQIMRWVGVYLMTIGIPEGIAQLTFREEVIEGIAGAVIYGLADGGWLIVKWKQFREWLAVKRGWGKKE